MGNKFGQPPPTKRDERIGRAIHLGLALMLLVFLVVVFPLLPIIYVVGAFYYGYKAKGDMTQRVSYGVAWPYHVFGGPVS